MIFLNIFKLNPLFIISAMFIFKKVKKNGKLYLFILKTFKYNINI